MPQVTVDRYALDKVFGVNPINYDSLPTRMGKAFADSATGIVQNLVKVGADIHDTVVPEGYESMLNPLAKGIESVKEDIGYRSGIDFQGMQEGLRNDGLSGFWSKFKFEDIPELMAQSFPYMAGAYNAAGFAAISASMAKEMAKNTAVNEGRDPNQTTLSDTLTALPAGMAITALDSLIPNTMTANVMKSIVGRSATTAANRVADRGISTLIKDVATSVVTEGATESVQELIQFAQEHKGQGVLSPEALSQYGVAGLLGGMSGGTMNVAMKPVETISSIMPSKTTKPAIDSLEAGEIDTRQVDILNKKVNTDTFQSLPEEEKMNIIDNAVFNSPLEVIDNKAKVVLSDGSGMFEVDLTIADDATSFGKLIRSDGTGVELTGGYGQYLDMIYGSIYNKIQSFDTVESLNKFMEQSGLDKVDPTNNVVHTAVANKAAEIQSMLLNEKAKSQTKGSFGKGIDTSNLYGAMNDIHTNFMKEMTNKTEKELFASIGRLVFNPDTLQPRNRQASKKVQALKDLVTAEEQYMLYRYIQQYGNVNNSNTKKVAAFIEKQYGIKTTYYNKIGMFKFSSISEPVVEQPIIPAVSPSPKIEIQPTSTTTGSDMEIPSTTTSQITPEKYGQNGIVESNEKTDNKPEKRKQSAKTESIVEKDNDTNKVNKISVKKGNKKVSYTLFNSVTGKNETKTGYRLTIPEFPNVELYITKETGNKKWEIEISHPTKGVLTFPTGYATTISDVLNSFVYDVNNKYSKNEEHRKILSEIGIHIPPKESIVEKSAKKSITIGGINIEYESVPEDSIKSLAVNGKDGIKIQKNITKDKFIKYLKGELANDAVSKNIIAIKQQADNMMKDKYGKSLIEIVDKLFDNDIRKFILLHEHRHNMQRAVDRSNNEYKTFIEAYKANPAKFEFDANEFALLKMGLISKPKEGVDNGLQEQETTEEVSEEIPVEEVREQSKDFTGITPDGISARNTNRMVKAKNIATKLGMDLSTQVSNLQNELKQFRTSILGMLPSTEQLDRQAIHGKNFNKNFANDDYIKTLQIDNKSGLYYVSSLLGAINSIKSNQPLFISRYDEDTETYVEILSNEQVEQVNNFGGIRLEEVVNTIARTLTNEFNLRPTDKFDDNANNTINEQAYKGALLAIKSLVSTGKLEELSIQDKDKVIHRFYKLADDSVYDNVSIFAKELNSRDIKSPNFVLDVNSNENPNIVDKTQLRSNGVKVSKKTEKALRMLQKQLYKINLDMQDILLDDALMNDSEFINNIIHFDNPANHHPNFREQIESTNNAYKRTLDRLIDFVKLAKDEEEFWFKYQVNSNGRFQPYATVANPVSDKLFARWIVDNSHSNAMYEVTKNGTDKTTYQWKHSIVLAFSEAKLIDFKSPDKKDGKANLEAFDSIANSTTISDALKLLSQGKKSEAVKLVSKGGLHSIRAFLDYAKYVELSDNESFDTSMPTEVDGITNGLVMQLMQVFNGAKASTVPYLKMVGVYLKGGDVNSIYDYRNRGNDDIYTTVANQVIRYLENTPAKEFLSAIDAMSRSVAKSPVMVWLYNAGNYGIEMKVGSSVVENFMEVAYQDSLKEPKNRTITAEMLDGMHMFYIDEISKLKDNKIQVSKEQFKELLNKVVKGTKLSEKDILNLETAFGLSVGKQITNSMEQQFNGISNAKNIFSEVSQFINESFYKTYKTIGRKAYLEQITISGHKDTESGVSTYTNDKELNPDKRYGIYYNNNGKVSVVSTSPIEKVVQNPFNKEGKPRGQKRGFVVLTHNLDATVMADSVIDFIGKNKYFGFPIFDAFVSSASSMNDFMSTYNNNLYRINKDYSNLEALQQALISAKDLLSKYNLLTKVNQNKFNELDTLVAESINQNNAMRKDMYSDTGIDVSHINQMSGIQPYEEYEQSLSQGSSSDSITGTLTETRVLKKDTNDFVELFDEIKQLDEVPVEENHSKYLRDLVGYIQNRLGDYQKETKVDIYKDAVSNAGEYYAENIKLSIGNKVSSYAYQSMQEIYAHELVHKAVDKAFKTDAKTRNELNVIFNKFIDYVKSNNTTLPKATFDYILSVNDASEFASYAVTNKDVMNVLEQIPSTLPSKSTGKRKTMFEILSEAVKLMISKFMTVTRLENSSLKLLTAKNAREEVDIVIAEMMAVNKQFNSIKKDNIFNQTYKGIGKVNAPISSAIQATTRVIKTSPIGRAFHDSLVNRGMMYRLANNQFVRAFSNEIVRRPKEEEALLKLTKLAINTNSNYINQKRAISNAVNDALNNATTQDRIALKNILLDLDCVSVFNDAKEIGEYLNNKALRYQKIKDIQNSILSMAKTDKQKNYARFIINQAIGLGYNLATHDSILNQAQLLNADNITNFKLVNHSKNVENFAADKVTRELLTKQVDLLATLYGINNSKMSDVALAGKYIAANTSAIDNILEFQLAQVNRSKEQLFNLKGESHLYMKGYSATMLNPNDQYTVIEESKVAGMKKQGWKVLSDVVPTDIKYSSTQHKMVLMRRINVDPNYASGIISVQSPTSKGTTLNQIGLTLPKEDNKINVDSYISNVISDISTMPTGQMIPLLSPSGKTFEVANYRYMMTKNNKTALLGMINDISTVMAETYAMTERKIRENQDNYDLVKAINKDYAEHTDSGEFVKIDNDGEYKDYWRMLPRDTRNYITRHNGEGFIYVRKQLINELFGYTNATVSQALRLKEEHYVLELMEKIWKDMVGIIRNSIVIRTFKVVYDNMFSNFRSVMLFMPADKAFKYMKEAWVLTDQYRKDHDKLTEIEARIASGKPYDKALHSRLKKAVESNPVIELFQEGKFEAIVDDLNIEEHDKRNIVEQKIEQLFDKINSKAVRDAADLVYIGEDTALYKALSKATIYGDFIARYAIYRHLRESNVSKDEAITTIDDMFVKYSVLQNKWIKWTGDMGMFVFSSYFFRIQRGIYRAFRDKSAYVGSQYAIEKITGDTSDITDSFIGGANITARLGTGFRNIGEIAEPHLLDNLGLI